MTGRNERLILVFNEDAGARSRWLRQKAGARRIQPTEGIYYVVRFPEQWGVMCLRFQPGQDVGHPDLWTQHISRFLAIKWSEIIGSTESHIWNLISDSPYAFPRGRVVKQRTRQIVFHGDDLEAFMGVSRDLIETAFGLQPKVKWQRDDHERCQSLDKEFVRSVLKLGEDWKCEE